MRIFLSYRRGDGGHAGRLTDALRARLGAKSVFQDVTAIAPGRDFTTAIDSALDSCDAALAVIGPGWLSASTPEGVHRLFEPGDYVRLELSRALERTVVVVPVLVGGARLPAAADLPAELRTLVQRQTVVLHDETWHEDVDGLVRSLRGELVAPTHRTRRRLFIGAAVALAALAALGATGWWAWGPGSGRSSSENDIPSCAPTLGQGWSPIVLNKNPTGETKTSDGSLIFTVKDARWRVDGSEWQVTLATTMEDATPGERYHEDSRYKSLVVGQREFAATCFSPNPSLVSSRTVGDAVIGFTVRCKPVGYIELILEDDSDRISVTDDTLKPGQC